MLETQTVTSSDDSYCNDLQNRIYIPRSLLLLTCMLVTDHYNEFEPQVGLVRDLSGRIR